MTYRQSNSSSKDRYSKPKSRLNQQIKCDSIDEGCPVMEESGTICGETDTFDVFQEFRQIYEDCIKKLEGTEEGNATLRKLAPFKKLIDDLWEQNIMLVETVEELEQEATCRVTNLQDKLNKSCQKICEFEEDIHSLVGIIQSLCKNGVYNPAGLKLNTLCPASVFGNYKESCFKEYQANGNDFGMEKCNDLRKQPLQAISEEEEKIGPDHDDLRDSPSVSSCLSYCSNCNVNDVREFNKNNFCNKNCCSPSFDESPEPDNDCDCQECAQPINIHYKINKYSFNIGNMDKSECCCNSFSTANQPETDYH